jgi:hypothetical protein
MRESSRQVHGHSSKSSLCSIAVIVVESREDVSTKTSYLGLFVLTRAGEIPEQNRKRRAAASVVHVHSELQLKILVIGPWGNRPPREQPASAVKGNVNSGPIEALHQSDQTWHQISLISGTDTHQLQHCPGLISRFIESPQVDAYPYKHLGIVRGPYA